MNKLVNKDVNPVFPELSVSDAKNNFLDRLRHTEMFVETYCDGDPALIRKRRKILEDGKHLLDDANDRSICQRLIQLFNARLATIPHERFLRKHIR